MPHHPIEVPDISISTGHPATDWHGRPYYSLDAWCKNTLRRKCYKIALNAHMTCPNRDGTLDTRGCIFCSADGSGDFATELCGDIEAQLAEGLFRLRDKFSPEFLPDSSVSSEKIDANGEEPSPCLIAYFQAYTNTYAPLPYLRRVYTEALECPSVCGISIGTRPDCLPSETLQLISELKELYPDKFIWIELGLQTIHSDTAAFLRRGYELPCFEETFSRLKEQDIPVIVHLILGLPGESAEQMLQSAEYLNSLLPFGVKLQLLHFLRDTDLGRLYCKTQESASADLGSLYCRSQETASADLGSPYRKSQETAAADISGAAATAESALPPLRPLEKEEYLSILIDILRHLSPEIVIHRLTGDGPKKTLLAPDWSRNKRDVLNSLHRRMREMHARQGDLFG